MISPTQILLIIVISILTAVLTFIGIQIFYILREGRRSIEKINKILDDAGTVSESIAKPISSLSNSITGLSGITGILSWLVKRKKTSQEEKK